MDSDIGIRVQYLGGWSIKCRIRALIREVMYCAVSVGLLVAYVREYDITDFASR